MAPVKIRLLFVDLLRLTKLSFLVGELSTLLLVSVRSRGDVIYYLPRPYNLIKEKIFQEAAR